MKADGWVCEGPMRKWSVLATLRVMAVCAVAALLVACTANEADPADNDGITLITSRGAPPIDSLVWSPVDDRFLVTAGAVGKGRAQVYILDPRKNEKIILAETNYGDFVSSAWALDGRRVLVLAREGSQGWEPGGFWMIDADGTSVEYLADFYDAAWSRDGSSIAAFMRTNNRTLGKGLSLQLIDIESRASTTLDTVFNDTDAFGLSWSRSGQELAFALGNGKPGDLYAFDLQTRQITRLTQGLAVSEPTWSPGGDLIAYTEWPEKGSRTTLHLMDPVRRCSIEIPELEYVWSPTWSPDGQRLAFVGHGGAYYMDISAVLGRDIYRGLCE